MPGRGSCHVNCAGGVAVLERVVEADDVGLAAGEHFFQCGHEAVFGWVVGPQGKDAAGVELGGEAAEAVGLIERGMALVEEVVG